MKKAIRFDIEERMRLFTSRCSLVIGTPPRGNSISASRLCNLPIGHGGDCAHRPTMPDLREPRLDCCRRCGDWLRAGAAHDCRTAVPA